ncbi:MAG: UDP-N-acetylmuramoyl-L-alanine--D-glutamate ligase [Bacteroidota bacterium]
MDRTQATQTRFTVVGGARSGLAVARLLAQVGAPVFLTDRADPAPGLTDKLEDAGVAYEVGGHTALALDADALVLSPGVPSTANLVQQALRVGVPVYSEIEVASWFCQAPVVAVTGTNGKTTTTSLVGHVLRTARAGTDHATIVAGNIGYPFSDYVLDARPADVVVLEVSSFQLDHISTFQPRVSVLLNITPDHLDRYDYNFTAYAHSKFRVFENQTAGDALVYNADDPVIHEYVTRTAHRRPSALLPFSQQHEPEVGAFVRDNALVLRMYQQENVLMQVNQLALRGRHNLYNSLAAAVAARAMEVRSDVVRESLASFEGVPHRLEHVRTLEGVRYVNDSKATNVNAVWYALESYHQPVVLILGGRDKGNDYSSLRPLVRSGARALVVLGESSDKIMRELAPEAPHSVQVDSLEQAIQAARLLAEPGDTVLLSPACSSFDMFENYEDRGDTFKRLVRAL